jgi:tellurite resistance protein TehA-like permease
MIQIKHKVKYTLDLIPVVLSAYLYYVLRFELHKLSQIHNIPEFKTLSTITIIYLIVSSIICISNWVLTTLTLTNNINESLLKNYRIIETLLIISHLFIGITMIILSIIAFTKLDNNVLNDADVKVLISFSIITPLLGIILDITDFLM